VPTFEIALLIIGFILLVISFLLPESKNKDSAESKKEIEKQVHDQVESEMNQVRGRVDDVINEAMDYAMEKTEKNLEKICTEKIMAVSDYSDTVLEDIHKNHEEAMFLYDILNAKHNNLKEVAEEVDQKVKAAEEASNLAMQATKDAKTVTEMASTVAPMFQHLDDIPKVEKDDKVIGTGTVTDVPTEAIPVTDTNESSEFLETIGEEDMQADYEKIITLHSEGLSAVEIAKVLGRGVGEIELIIRFSQYS